MEFLRKSWAQIRIFFSHLSLAEKWLIVAVLAVLVLAVFIGLQYAASPEMVPISPFASDRQSEVIQRLQQNGIRTEVRHGLVNVPQDKLTDALVVLQRGNLLTADTSAAFDDMVKRQTPWQTNAEKTQAFLLAKQKVLGLIIVKMTGVRGADVILSLPEQRGFGATDSRPSASVNLVMQGGKSVNKQLVEAVAGLVSGAVAGMKPQDVVIVDALAGRQFTIKNAQDALPSETLEHLKAIEDHYYTKVRGALEYIPGVIVAVNVQTDPTVRKTIESVDYEKAEPVKTDFSRETERRGGNEGGTPGRRSNNGLDIEAAGGGNVSTDKTTENRTEFGPKQPTRKTTAVEAGHTPQQISVTVNVPRSYFVRLFKQAKGGDAAKPDAPEPDDAALQSIMTTQLAQIQAQVEPLVSSGTAKGVIKTSMIPDHGMVLASGLSDPGGGPAVAGGGGVQFVLESGWIKPAGLALLALASLGIMFTMVRKATQAPPMPTAEELAGVPPTLPSDDDLVGEAEETDASMAGVELDEEELRHRKIAEQIAEMVKANPMEAASLVRRWVRTEE